MAKISEKQFIDVYNEYAEKIFKYCYFRVNSKEDAEDLASKTFMKTWDYIVNGKKIDQMRAFLYRVAHNAIIDFYKSRQRQQEKEMSLDAFEDETIDIPDETDFVKDIEIRNAIKDVQEKIKELPDNYGEIIILRYINDLSLKEIAEVTGLTENNATVRLHRATEALKKKIT